MNKAFDYIQFIVIDLFCGAGGTTIGFEQAESTYEHMYNFLKSQGITPPQDKETLFKICKVVGCVNHDHLAIKSHWENHAEIEHFEEDIRLLNPYGSLKRLVEIYRAFYPNAKVILWASLECTNFSKAKGGMSRDADSRTLAEHLYKYIDALEPDYIQIENVVEFMAWGPMVPKVNKTPEGYAYCPLILKQTTETIYDIQFDVVKVLPHWVPESKNNGKDWMRWRNQINSRGYHDEWKQLNSADFGAYTSRNRLFGCFAKDGLPIVWPIQTHHKKPEKQSIPIKKWEPVKKVLDFMDEGLSIFNRKKNLSVKTMQRLFMGCVKHIAGGKEFYNEHFITKYFSGDPLSKNISIEGPAGTIKTKDGQALVKACFITKWNSNNAKTGGHSGHSIFEPSPVVSTQNRLGLVNADFLINYAHSSSSADINKPAPTVTTHDKLGKVQAHFIQKYYSTGGQHNSIEEPAASLTTKDRLSKVSATFIDQQFTSGKRNQSCNEPLGTITTVPKSKLVQADFFIDKQFSGDDNHQSIEEPAGTILTNDKHNLVQADKFIMNTNYNNIGSNIDEPAPVLTASRRHPYLVNTPISESLENSDECIVILERENEVPLYFIKSFEGHFAIPVYADECEWTIKIKEFMSIFNICDVKMRMLKVIELKKIQGFPDNYVLRGNQTAQKKFIGNSVVPLVPKSWITAFSIRLAA